LQEAESRAASAANQAANATVDQQRLDQRLLTLPEDYPDRASLQAQADHTQNVRAQLERVAESARRTAESVYQKVQTLRTAEAAASEQWQASIAVEDRAREELRPTQTRILMLPENRAPRIRCGKSPSR
jgi:phage-related tail protein